MGGWGKATCAAGFMLTCDVRPLCSGRFAVALHVEASDELSWSRPACAGALRPTMFCGVPRVFDRIYGGVMAKVRALVRWCAVCLLRVSPMRQRAQVDMCWHVCLHWGAMPAGAGPRRCFSPPLTHFARLLGRSPRAAL